MPWRFLLLYLHIRAAAAFTANVVFTAVRECDSASGIQLSELEFRTIGGTRIEIPGVSNPGGRNPGRETASNLIDSDATSKWLDFNMVAPGSCLSSTLYFSNLPDRPASMILTTANDSPARDPISFTVEVCDGEECQLYTFSSVSPPTARFSNYDAFSLITSPSRSPSSNPTVSDPTISPATSIPTSSPSSSSPTDPPQTSSPSPEPSSTEPTNRPSSSPTTGAPTISPNALDCFDTIGWDNTLGMGCTEYERSGWCNGISAESWVSGPQFNYPTRNCCACGKKAYDRYKARLDAEELENVELATSDCQSGIWSNERLRVEKLKTMQKQMRIIEERIGNHCKSDASLELEQKLRHRMEEVKAYVVQAIKSLLSSLGLSTTIPSPDIWFGQVNGYDQLCVTSSTYDTLVLPEDSLEICMQFCQYSESCEALSYQSNQCLLLHSLPTDTVSTVGASCMYKATSSGSYRFENTTDQLCSCSPTVKPTDAPSQSPTTAKPSQSPSFKPSFAPTTKPSDDPSQTPSETPSTIPTDLPTHKPSRSPTKSPTAKPSGTPSTNPSHNPSSTPSSSPSFKPSRSPDTSSPTEAPTSDQPSISPTVDLQKFNITFVVDTTSGLNQGGSLDSNVASVQTFILDLMDGLMREDNFASLFFYSCCDHEIRTNAFDFTHYADVLSTSSITPKEYYESLIPTSFAVQARDPDWLNAPTDAWNPNLQHVMFAYWDLWSVEPGTPEENIMVIIVHSLARAEEFVVQSQRYPEGVRILFVSVGSLFERATYLDRYHDWSAGGTFFYFGGFDTFSDMDASVFITWLRSINFPYTPLPVQ